MKYEMPSSNDQVLWNIWMSQYWMPSITAADELGIFAFLAEQPASARELSDAMELNARACSILLPMLTSLGLLTRRIGRYHLTDAGRSYLLPTSPFYWGGVFAVERREPRHKALIGALTRETYELIKGAPVTDWELGQVTTEQARPIAAFMHSQSLASAVGVARHPGFGDVRRLLDVGGGSGCLSIAIAQHHPEIACTIMDLPAMCELAQEYIREGGVADRVDTVPIDMFRDEWPSGYDAILFSNVFHDWSLSTCEYLAEMAFRSLPEGGRVFVHEMLIDDASSGPRTAAACSIHMLLNSAGRQFTLNELSRILRGAGLAGVACEDTSPLYSLVSAERRPPDQTSARTFLDLAERLGGPSYD